MNKIQIERTIKVDVIQFDDGIEIDVSTIREFLNEAYSFEDTIGKDGNWTYDYIFFSRKEEKKLEPILLKLDVIRLSPNHKYINDRVNIDKHIKEYAYWLSDGYNDFVSKFWNLLD
jgi:hypothetical protein